MSPKAGQLPHTPPVVRVTPFCLVIVVGGILASAGCGTMKTPVNQAAVHRGSGPRWTAFEGVGDGNRVAHSDAFHGPLKTVWSYTPSGANNGFLDWGPVVAGEKVFTPNGLNRVIALNSDTSLPVWEAALNSNVFSVTLTSDGSRLLATSAITAHPSPTLFALDPRTGKIVWNNQADGQAAIGGIESPPVISGNTVYAAYLRYEGAGGICAFDVNSGKQRWCWKRQGQSPMSPIGFGQGRLYAAFDDHALVCLEARSGRELWSFSGPSSNLLSSPVVAGRQMLAAWGGALYSLDASTGKQLWMMPLEATVEMSSPAVYEGVAYVGTKEGLLLAHRVSDGSLAWKSDLKAGALNSSPVVDDATKTVWIGSSTNTLIGVSIASGEVVASLKVSEEVGLGFWRNSPALCGSRLYIGSTNKHLYAIAPADSL